MVYYFFDCVLKKNYLALDRIRLAQMDEEEGMRIKDAIAQVVQEHPLPDGSLPNRKQVYAAVLAMKD